MMEVFPESQFKEINEAYQILSNPEKRDYYDRYGKVATEGLHGFSDFGSGGLGDIFESFFSGFSESPLNRTAQRTPQKGDNND